MKKIVTFLLLLSSFTLCTAAESTFQSHALALATAEETFTVYLDETEPFTITITPSVLNRLEIFKAAPELFQEEEKTISIRDCSIEDFDILFTYISIGTYFAVERRRDFLESLTFKELTSLIRNSSMLLLQELDREDISYVQKHNDEGQKIDLFEYVLRFLTVDQIDQLGQANLLQSGAATMTSRLDEIGTCLMPEEKEAVLKKYSIWPI